MPIQAQIFCFFRAQQTWQSKHSSEPLGSVLRHSAEVGAHPCSAEPPGLWRASPGSSQAAESFGTAAQPRYPALHPSPASQSSTACWGFSLPVTQRQQSVQPLFSLPVPQTGAAICPAPLPSLPWLTGTAPCLLPPRGMRTVPGELPRDENCPVGCAQCHPNKAQHPFVCLHC